MIRQAIKISTIAAALFVTGCGNNSTNSFEVPFDGELSHVHGMGYVENHDRLYFASHSGLKSHEEGNWYETKENFHDYMGFNAVDDGFYTSGHPSAASDLPNPLGIQRSVDRGENLEEVTLQGETDFHVMAVGYNSHDIILINPAKNSLLEAGVYRSDDEGESWEPVSAEGLHGEVSAFALHPINSNFVAAATNKGIYFSDDAGETFEAITKENETGTSVFFNEDHLYFGSFGTAAVLKKYTIENGNQEKLNIPEMPEDAIVFTAQNPSDEKEMAIYTMGGQAYLTKDSAETWELLIEEGRTQ